MTKYIKEKNFETFEVGEKYYSSFGILAKYNNVLNIMNYYISIKIMLICSGVIGRIICIDKENISD